MGTPVGPGPLVSAPTSVAVLAQATRRQARSAGIQATPQVGSLALPTPTPMPAIPRVPLARLEQAPLGLLPTKQPVEACLEETSQVVACSVVLRLSSNNKVVAAYLDRTPLEVSALPLMPQTMRSALPIRARTPVAACSDPTRRQASRRVRALALAMQTPRTQPLAALATQAADSALQTPTLEEASLATLAIRPAAEACLARTSSSNSNNSSRTLATPLEGVSERKLKINRAVEGCLVAVSKSQQQAAFSVQARPTLPAAAFLATRLSNRVPVHSDRTPTPQEPVVSSVPPSPTPAAVSLEEPRLSRTQLEVRACLVVWVRQHRDNNRPAHHFSVLLVAARSRNLAASLARRPNPRARAFLGGKAIKARAAPSLEA